MSGNNGLLNESFTCLPRYLAHFMKTKPEDLFKGKPWSSFDEYYTLTKKYHLAGKELEAYLKKESKKRFIPYPNIYPSKHKTIT